MQRAGGQPQRALPGRAAHGLPLRPPDPGAAAARPQLGEGDGAPWPDGPWPGLARLERRAGRPGQRGFRAPRLPERTTGPAAGPPKPALGGGTAGAPGPPDSALLQQPPPESCPAGRTHAPSWHLAQRLNIVVFSPFWKLLGSASWRPPGLGLVPRGLVGPRTQSPGPPRPRRRCLQNQKQVRGCGWTTPHLLALLCTSPRPREAPGLAAWPLPGGAPGAVELLAPACEGHPARAQAAQQDLGGQRTGRAPHRRVLGGGRLLSSRKAANGRFGRGWQLSPQRPPDPLLGEASSVQPAATRPPGGPRSASRPRPRGGQRSPSCSPS